MGINSLASVCNVSSREDDKGRSRSYRIICIWSLFPSTRFSAVVRGSSRCQRSDACLTSRSGGALCVTEISSKVFKVPSLVT